MMVDGHLINVGDKLEILTDHMRTQQSLMRSLAETQVELKPILAQLATGFNDTGGLDDASRIHLRNLDVYVTRLVEELKTGREDTTQQIRSEIKLLARLIAASSGDGQSS